MCIRDRTVVVEFWAKFNEANCFGDWDKLEDVVYYRVDIAKAPKAKKKYKVRMAPTLIIFKGGVKETVFKAGLDLLYINLYDGPEQMEHFDNMLAEARIHEDQFKYRMHWGDFEKHGLILNNRSGVIDWVGIEEGDIKSLPVSYTHLTLPTILRV